MIQKSDTIVSDNIVKDLFKVRASPRKKVSSIFTQKESTIPVSASQKIPLDGQRPKFFPPAVDIGSTSLKLLQLAKTSRGYEIAKIGFTPLERNTKRLSDTKPLLEAMIKDNKIKGEVVSVLPLSMIQAYSFFLPDMPDSEIDQAVIWKLKQNPPSGMLFDSFSFDYIYCEHAETSQNNEIRILAFIVSKSTLVERINLFKSFSLELVSVEPEPYATFISLAWMGKISAEETVIVLQLGAKESTITIVHAGFPYVIRPVTTTGNTLTESIANYHQCDWLKAEAIKKQEGLKNWAPGAQQGEQDTSAGTAALSSQLEGLILEIEQSFRAFTQQIKRKQLNSFNRLILCGGSASLINLDKFLSQRLEVPVEVFNPLASLQQSGKQEFHPVIKENSNRFSSVLGSAARTIEW